MKIAIIVVLGVFLAAGVCGILVVIGAGKLSRRPVDFKRDEDKTDQQ